MKWEFSSGKKHFTSGKNRKNGFAPSEKYSSYAPVQTPASCIQPQFLGLWASDCETADWLQITPA